MHIAVFHDNYDKYQLIHVPRMDREIDLLFKAHEERLVCRIRGIEPTDTKPPPKRGKKAS